MEGSFFFQLLANAPALKWVEAAEHQPQSIKPMEEVADLPNEDASAVVSKLSEAAMAIYTKSVINAKAYRQLGDSGSFGTGQ